jgi:hypothetical protein
MITLPDFSQSFEYENSFYWTSDIFRMSKIIAHYELFKISNNVPGHIVECGLFKGASFIRFATFRHLFNNANAKRMIGFDAFGTFPETAFEPDFAMRENFIAESGETGISEDQLMEVLRHKGCADNVDLVKGDVRNTVPNYIKENPSLKISLLNIDVDVYEATKVCIEELYDYVTVGGVIILDDYSNVFPGANKAIDEFFTGRDVEIKRFPFSVTPCYTVKRG